MQNTFGPLVNFFSAVVQKLHSTCPRVQFEKKYIFLEEGMYIFNLFRTFSEIFWICGKVFGNFEKSMLHAKNNNLNEIFVSKLFVGIGYWRNVFSFLVEKFLIRCENCVVHVKKNVLSRNFSLILLKFFQDIEQKTLVVGRKSWQCCQNCIPGVERITLEEFFKKVVFPILFGH